MNGEKHIDGYSDYTLGSLNAKMENVEAKIDELIKLLRIQNGRVNSLELWRSALIGGWVVTMAIIVPLFVVILQQYL